MKAERKKEGNMEELWKMEWERERKVETMTANSVKKTEKKKISATIAIANSV